DADAGGVDGVDQGDVSMDPAALPADGCHGIVGHLAGAGENSVLLETQQSVGAQLDGSGEIVAGGDEYFAAAEYGATIERLLQRGGVLGCAVTLAPKSRTLRRAGPVPTGGNPA